MDSCQQICSHNPKVKVAIEYKQKDPRQKQFLSNVGKTLALINDVGLPNSYQSAAFDGRYIYCCPGQRAVPLSKKDAQDQGHYVTGLKPGTVPQCVGLMLRCDTKGEFKDRRRLCLPIVRN